LGDELRRWFGKQAAVDTLCCLCVDEVTKLGDDGTTVCHICCLASFFLKCLLFVWLTLYRFFFRTAISDHAAVV